MTLDWHKVLCEVVGIVNREQEDFPRVFQKALAFLQEALPVDEVVLLLMDSFEGPVSQVIPAAGPVLFNPSQFAGRAVDPMAMASPGSVVRNGCQVQCAAGETGRGSTVLSLSLPPDFPCSPQFEALVGAVTLLMHNRSMQWRMRREPDWARTAGPLSLLAELARKINQARTMNRLLQAASFLLQTRLSLGGVFLRPLVGGTVHSAPVFHIAGHWAVWETRMLELEEQLAFRVLENGAASSAQEEICEDLLAEWSGPEVRVLPLVLGKDLWGVMTVFGEQAEKTQSSPGPHHEVLMAVAELLPLSMERVAALEELKALSAENLRKLEETSLLYRISRAIHSTLRLDELIHLILSAATVEGGPGFERAMLFMVNERSGILQGMLGVTRETAPVILPIDQALLAWERPEVGETAREAQRQAPFCRQVMKQRLPLDPSDNPLAKAVQEKRVVFVPTPQSETTSFEELTRVLGLAPCACAPLLGRKRVLGVLVVDNPRSGTEIHQERRHFLELFANQAAQAMENCLLLHRLEESHRDLRETQERMIQGEKMAALGETAASVTHELRNPLVAIGGFAQRLAKIGAEGSSEKEYSAIIVREVRRMEEMLTNILAFSRKQMLCIGECQIEAIIEEALTLEEDALQRAGVQVVCEIAENLPVVRGDEQKLRQVLVNLMANARQVMISGGRLTIRAYPTFLRGDQAVAVEVEDTGGGISPEVMRNIFNPFFTTRESGTGLGLSIVHRIIEHHYGDIEVQNREKGALFIVRLAVDGVPKALPFR